jgi:hypothetical protein
MERNVSYVDVDDQSLSRRLSRALPDFYDDTVSCTFFVVGSTDVESQTREPAETPERPSFQSDSGDDCFVELRALTSKQKLQSRKLRDIRLSPQLQTWMRRSLMLMTITSLPPMFEQRLAVVLLGYYELHSLFRRLG